MQKNTDAEIFKNFYSDTNIKQLDSKHDFINILNFKELNLILETINNKNLKSYLNFKLDLSFLLQEKFDKFLEVLNKHTGFKYNFYIFSDTRYSASKKEINHFIDLIYTLKTQKKLSKPEKKIFDLSYSLFNIKLFDSINDLLLNLFPLTTTSKIYKKYNVSSMEYMINKSKYITLFDNQNFFTFDTETGYLKKWFLHNKGICLINFDSFIETLYIKNKKGTTPVQIQNLNYFKFNNGIMFKYDSKKSVSMEKNIILQHSKLLLTYKIKNNFKKKKSFILMLENKFSPSLLNNLIALNNNYSFHLYKKKFTSQYKKGVSSFLNLNTGYGIAWTYYLDINGVEFFKSFYSYTKKIYYKFDLYPYEQKVITISYKKKYIKRNQRISYLKTAKPITNQYYGDYLVE